MQPLYRYALSALIILAAIAAVSWHFIDYFRNPWTRDGQVRADVIQVAPRVSGPIVSLPIRDNQRVSAGDILFQIDPRTYQAALDEAQAMYDQTVNNVAVLTKRVTAAEAGVAEARSRIVQAESQVMAADSTLTELQEQMRRSAALLQTADISQARFDQVKRDYDVNLANKRQAEAAVAGARSAHAQAEAKLAEAQADLGGEGESNERIRGAAAQLENARLDLEFTTVRASRDGYVTNLGLRVGSQAVANQPILALIDESSFWIDAYFRETFIRDIQPGDQAVITLMGHPDDPFTGTVDSISWGIAKQDGSTGINLLPNVQPTFQWIRLAQRIPVRIDLGELPEGVTMRIGQTASVLVHAIPSDSVVAAPALLQ
ncbi:Multidrug resistance efflux pump [Paracoccus halophilus]|uniref:Multidrug resistance efflux pump n=1 Tax=Paracoccus halophilus TaxID=376733 RepID=A0A099F4Y0_9RHOB|nr:HlyD family secretion protein [Paracoccus halophilus]KGJ05328.1 RND transporter [Paracoccus halophilus]SFA48675.1 Multidrug resistance efflux pump [Paracoccus halophilus]